jgi:uncharacterized iron-regulated membrane protein
MKLYRKLHRYFGIIIGIQFLFWTVGGIFFTWSNIDQIHGDFNRKSEKLFPDMADWKSPENAWTEISKTNKIDSFLSLKVIRILDEPIYQIGYFDDGEIKIALVKAKTGKLRAPLNKNEAVALAVNAFTPKSEVKHVELITKQTVNKHHEYRNQPLPAYSVRFDHKSGTRIYVSTEYGEVIKFRNSNWRVFDFLWMMHTMDYQNRDNFGNILLRIFSVLGLVTIITGFILYFQTLRHSNKQGFLFSSKKH